MARILGIDLGSHTVKIAIFEGGFGRYQFSGYRVQRVDAVGPPDIEARLQALGTLMKELGSASNTTAMAALPGDQATARVIRLPFTDRAKVEKTLPFEVENQVPFDLEDMILVSRFLEAGPDGSQVLTALAPRDRIRPLLQGMAAHGADPKALILDAELLADYADEGVQAVIDLGHSQTVISLCRGGQILTARTICHGGQELTAALAHELDLDWGAAEGRKHISSLADAPSAAIAWEDDEDTQASWQLEEHTEPRPDDLDLPAPESGTREREILLRALRPLLIELRAVLIAMEDEHGLDIDEALICGGTAALSGMPALLSQALGVPVRTIAVEDTDTVDAPERFALAHALGAKASRGAKGRLLDFRQEDLAFRGDLIAMGNLARYGAVLVVFFLFAGTALFGWRSVQLKREIAATEQQIAAEVLKTFPDVDADRLDDSSMALAIMQEKTSETSSRVEALGAVIATEPPTLGLLKEISEAVPPAKDARIDVRELSITPTAVTMKAETDGFEAAAKVQTAIQADPRFKDARRGDEKKVKNGVRFTITIPLGDSTDQEG